MSCQLVYKVSIDKALITFSLLQNLQFLGQYLSTSGKWYLVLMAEKNAI